MQLLSHNMVIGNTENPLAHIALTLSDHIAGQIEKIDETCRKFQPDRSDKCRQYDHMTIDKPKDQNRLGTRRFNVTPDRPLTMLQACPAYSPTPLQDMAPLAQALGIARLWAKDETARMGLGSFKSLGGAFAVAQMICDVAGTNDLNNDKTRSAAAGMTFITASAGNHGLSVAAGARIFGAASVIVLATAVPEAFADRIRAAGGRVVRAQGSYEDSVSKALSLAEEHDWLLLSDGSWEGNTERPALVMEGYTVLAEECRQAFEQSDIWPTHVLLQAGVGGMAAAVSAHIRETWPTQPTIIIVEPDAAPCLFESVAADKMVQVEGPVSNMGRLDCKDASLIAFEALRQDANCFVTVSDAEAEEATKLLAAHGLETTPSGAAALAALVKNRPDPESRCLIVVSEGPEVT